MKCKECLFYTGVKCHGHNDYWGECIMINTLYKEYNNIINKRNKELKENSKIYLFDYICYDETNCKYKKFIHNIYTKNIINEKEFNILSSKKFYNKCLEMYNFNKWLQKQLNTINKTNKNNGT